MNNSLTDFQNVYVADEKHEIMLNNNDDNNNNNNNNNNNKMDG